jgi:8-amino-7-oxononanoate synthase
MTSHPRPLSAFLLTLGMNARPITWPTVPKGKDRVRVCLHAGNTREDVERLVEGVVEWAEDALIGWQQERMRMKQVSATRLVGVLLESKL